MTLYFNHEKEVTKVSEKELIDLGKSLKNFISVYVKHIYIKTDDQREILNRLNYIADLILARRYDMLFDNPNIIEYDLYMNQYNNDLPPWE